MSEQNRAISEGRIGFVVSGSQAEGSGIGCVTIQMLNSSVHAQQGHRRLTMAEWLRINELPTVLNVIASSHYIAPATFGGFDYTLDFMLEEGHGFPYVLDFRL